MNDLTTASIVSAQTDITQGSYSGPVLSVAFGSHHMVKFATPEEARRAATELMTAASKLEEALCASSGRRIMDVRNAHHAKGERVYLVTQAEDDGHYSEVRQMRYPNPPHAEAATMNPGESWSRDGYTYTLHGLFDMVTKLDENITRYIEVEASPRFGWNRCSGGQAA